MAKQMILLVLSMLVALSLAQLGAKPPRNNTKVKVGSGGFADIQDVPTERQKSPDGKKSLDVGSDGAFKIKNENNNKTVVFKVSKIEQLDSNDQQIPGDRGQPADFGIDGPNMNPDNGTLNIKGKTDKAEASGATLDFSKDIGGNGARSNPKFKQGGKFEGMQQANEFKVGNLTVTLTVATKTDDSTSTMQVGDNISEMKKGDTKASVSITGFTPCGKEPMGRNCTVNGVRHEGKKIRVFLQMENMDGAKAKPTMKSSGRLRGGSGTNDTEHTLDGDSNMAVTMMSESAVDDGSKIEIVATAVTAKTWMQNNKQISGFTVDIPILNFNESTVYFYDPTIIIEDTSTDSDSGAQSVVMSTLLVCVLSIFKFFL